MQALVKNVMNFVREEEGAAAVEYGLLIALIAAVIVVAVKTLGQTINTKFGAVNTAITTP